MINASSGFVAVSVHWAFNLKTWAASAAYLTAALTEFFVGQCPKEYKVTVMSDQQK